MKYVSEATDLDHIGLRTYRVEPGQFFVAEPGSPHRAHVAADADGECRLLGMGAPPQSDGHSYEVS
ncbi:hypothetical protein [Halomicrobium sp. IBSBa]|uniref:hypothetical protein n=1 Tax=Halomicrobium sp. IBSBa TaxID=2778916 RepID=UPI001ABF8450|nr:hypothetical protein [Halomicrobium sp. IBSBa]